MRDAAGEPTGLLLERAVDLVRAILPEPPDDLTLAAVREAQGDAHRLGVTGIHDVEGPEALRALRSLETADELRLRVLFHPPVSRLLRAGSALVFGSDVPVASIDPREGVFAAMERRGFDGAPAAGWYPKERLTFEESVAAYTRGAAAAAGVTSRRGTLAPGQDADLVAWAIDPAVLRGAGEAVRAGRASMTVVGGEVVMRS